MLHHKTFSLHVYRFVIGSVFLIAALHKTHSPEQTLDALAYTFSWATGATGKLILTAVVFIEMLIGCLYLAGHLSKSTLLSTFTLLILYLFYLVKLALDPDSPACGCLGTTIQSVRVEHILGMIRNVALIGCIACIWLYQHETEESTTS